MSIAIVYSAIITYETIIQYDNFTLERFSANSLVSSREQLINTGKQVISEFNLTEVLLGKGISGGRFAVASIYDPEEKVKNIEYRSDILLKIKNTANQSLLNKEQRQENLKNAYEVKNKEYISNKNILIFDDIYTTGSTANECSKMLVEAGARSIGILTIAKD